VKRVATLAAAVVAATMATSCASKPTMKLNHAEVSGLSFGFPPQASVVMTNYIDVTNPNSYDVAVRAVRGNVTLADKYTVPVDFHAPNEGLWLPAKQTSQVRVPLSIPVPLALQLVREAMGGGTIPFHLVAKADVTATRSLQIESDNYEVDEKGVVTREQVDAALRTVFPFGVGVGGGG
jgi:hypothetical protein